MSWTRTTASGSGQLAWRVEIEGYPSCLVTHASMVQTDGDGRTWLLGLKSDGWKFGQKVDLITAKAEGSSLRVKFANRAAGAALFAKRPTAVTYLASDATAAETTSITVKSSDGFAASGKLYVNTETIAYAAKSASTTFNTLTRGVWDSLAQAHYTTDGDRLRYPEVTDWPVVLEGRRVRFYVYGAGDSKTGDGTLVWTGVASTDVAFNGQEWSFQVDSLFRVLDQEIGSDLRDPSPIRGIYYPATAPLIVRFYEYSGPTVGTAANVQSAGGVALAGFWESQAAFVADLQTAIDAMFVTQSFTSTVSVVEDGETWAIEFATSAITPLYIGVTGSLLWPAWQSPVDQLDGPYPVSVVGPRVTTVAAGTVYVYRQIGRLGTVPRAVLGTWTPALFTVADADAHGVELVDVDDALYPAWRIYLGGAAAVTSLTTAILAEWESTHDDAQSGTIVSGVTATSTSLRYVETSRLPSGVTDPFWAWCGGEKVPEVRQGRQFTDGGGSLADFLSDTSPGLAGQTATHLNTGAVPYVRPTVGPLAGDFSATQSALTTAAAETAFTARRVFTVFGEVTLRDLVEHECRLLGCYPVISSAGSIVFKRLALPAPSEVSSAAITASVILSDDQILSWERAALGIYNTVRVRTGYDPVEEEHTGSTYVVRDVAAYGQSPISRVFDIEPVTKDPGPSVDYADIVKIAGRVLGVFGGPYVYLTIEVPLTSWDTRPGDVVSLTWSKVPETDGTLGVTQKIGLVTAWEFEPMAARGQLTLMLTDQRIAGYVPGGRIASIDSGASGTTGPFVVTISTAYRPVNVSTDEVWTVGDLVRVFEWGTTTTANNELGTVTAASGSTLTFTTTAAWAHTGKTWAIGGRVSTAITSDSQKLFCYVARADGTLDWSGDTDNPPFTFAP